MRRAPVQSGADQGRCAASYRARAVPYYGSTERLLAESRLPFTVLRFKVWVEMLNLVGVAPRAVANGVLPSNSRDGRTGHVTRDDSAAVAAAVLAEGGSQGEILEVTGPEAVTDASIAAALSESTGRRIRYDRAADRSAAQPLSRTGKIVSTAVPDRAISADPPHPASISTIE
ncbi:hypothetical protein [Streptomyces sp. NPDC020597]|uniref:hypothetical protein n=1 Tax=unclassified Streptomyces TaxID=2593676 RepID=UPI003793A2CB